jgi:hypothetical protein
MLHGPGSVDGADFPRWGGGGAPVSGRAITSIRCTPADGCVGGIIQVLCPSIAVCGHTHLNILLHGPHHTLS